MGILKCTNVSLHYWNVVKLQEEAELIWKLRQEKLDLRQDITNADVELVRICAMLKASIQLCSNLEQYTLRKRQLDQLHILLYEFNLNIKYCCCYPYCRKYLMLILLQIFHFGTLDCQIPEYVLDLFQMVLKVFTGAQSEEIELIRKEQTKLQWKY